MRTLVLSTKAIDGIHQIALYIRQTSFEQAVQYQKGVRSSMDLLLPFPESCPLADGLRDSSLRRKVFNKRTIILYTFDEEHVYIEAVRDARSNWKAEF